MSSFEIVRVPEDASLILEYVGSKEKFWYLHKDEERWLFKAARVNTGEDWAEKVAAELCELLNLPHARYELAEWNGKRGVVSQQIHDRESESLILGNVLLARQYSNYPRDETSKFKKTIQYTPTLIFNTLEDAELNILPPRKRDLTQPIKSAGEMFVGYLLLDTWIGNTDRHDQNWGVLEHIKSENARYSLAPTFDHASSLGRELLDEKREMRLRAGSKGYQVIDYLQNKKGRSPFHDERNENEQLFNIEVFRRAASRYPKASKYWLDKLVAISDEQVKEIFEKIPNKLISRIGIEFALKVLDINKNVLLA